MSPSRRPRPSFDVARQPLARSGTAGWVYRSDAVPSVADEARAIESGDGSFPYAPPGPLPPSNTPGPPLVAAPAPSGFTLPSASTAIGFGVGAMMMPFALTMFVMLAPMRWMFGGSDGPDRQ